MGISFLNCPNYRVLCSFDSGVPLVVLDEIYQVSDPPACMVIDSLNFWCTAACLQLN